MNISRQKLVEIFLTALIGALIAFLQALLIGLTTHTVPTANPEVAAITGGALRYLYIMKFYS